jgi:hypothetical protein
LSFVSPSIDFYCLLEISSLDAPLSALGGGELCRLVAASAANPDDAEKLLELVGIHDVRNKMQLGDKTR